MIYQPYKGFYRLMLIVCVVLTIDVSSVTATDFEIKSGSPLMLELRPNSRHSLTVNDISVRASHLLIQVHTHYMDVTLSDGKTPSYDTSVVGHNLGLVTILEELQREKKWFLKVGSHKKNVTVLVYLSALNNEEPVPGGCNMVFPLENDPNSLVSYKNYITNVIYQWSNIGYGRKEEVNGVSLDPPSCESKLFPKMLSYHTYVKYLDQGDYSEKSYFSSLKKMLTSRLAQIYGTHIKSQLNNPSTQSTFSLTSRVGQGLIVVIVVSQLDGSDAIYVPITTYNCNVSNSERDCGITDDVCGKVLTVFALLFGLFLSFLGHRFFKTELVVFGLLAFSLISTILFMRYTDWDIGVILGASAAIGVVGGILWVLVWYCLTVPALSVSIPGLVGGYLLASVLFATPFGNVDVWSSPVNYGLAFTFATLLFPGILLAFTKTLNILACGFVGSYLIILLPDYYLYGSMQDLLLSSIRKGADDTYLKAINTLPYQDTEIALTVVWILLFIAALLFQFIRERKRPKFPYPRQQPQYQVPYHIPISQPVSEGSQPLPPTYTSPPVTERTPLLLPAYTPPVPPPQSDGSQQLPPPAYSASPPVKPSAPPPPAYEINY